MQVRPRSTTLGFLPIHASTPASATLGFPPLHASPPALCHTRVPSLAKWCLTGESRTLARALSYASQQRSIPPMPPEAFSPSNAPSPSILAPR
eukprot:357766-Chlamydomonas_euryale.AAC.3